MGNEFLSSIKAENHHSVPISLGKFGLHGHDMVEDFQKQCRLALVPMCLISSCRPSAATKRGQSRQACYNFLRNRREVSSRYQCDVEKMRVDQKYKNYFAANADRYEAYIRDGLAPWRLQLDKVHQLVDVSLGIQHD